MTGHRLAIASLLATTLVAIDPDDLTFNDLRLQVGLPPQDAEVTSNRSGSLVDASTTISWESRGRWTLQWVPPVSRMTPQGEGMCILEVSSLRFMSATASDGSQLTERAILGGLHLGIGAVVLQDTTLEVTGFAGGGVAWQERMGSYGSATEVGARIGLTWAPAHFAVGQPLVGIAILGAITQLDNKAELAGTNYHLSIRSQGFTPAVVVGWRF